MDSSIAKTKPQVITRKLSLKDFTSIFGLVLLVIISAILSPTFTKPLNMMNVLMQLAAPSMMAFGMTFVILTGGIDLSVASVLALSGVIIALTYQAVGWVVACLLALLMGIVVGMIHGLFITGFRVPPFIATLAGYTVYRGLALVLTNAAAIPVKIKEFEFIAAGKIDSAVVAVIAIAAVALLVLNFVFSIKRAPKGEKLRKVGFLALAVLLIAFFLFYIIMNEEVKGLPLMIIIVIAIIALGSFTLNRTVFGREVFALGGNYEAARLAGIKTKKNLIVIYAISGFLAALSGVLNASRLSSGIPQVFQGGELDAIAAVVIGGTSMSGGIGKLSGTVIGVLLIGVLNNLLSLLNVPTDMKMIFKGVIILVAVILDTKFTRAK